MLISKDQPRPAQSDSPYWYAMNEFPPWTNSQPLKAEVEAVDAGFQDFPEAAPAPEEWRPGVAPMAPNDKRVSHRYPAVGVGGRSWLGWYDGSNFRQTRTWILNISAAGCLIAADFPAPLDRSIWLRLDNATVPDWHEVRVVDHQRTDGGLLASRLVFRGVCSYELMKAVAFGRSHQPPGPEPSRSWILNSW
jgi:hypothetical protein